MKEEILDKTIREVAVEYSATIPYFIKHHVDFYCNGKLTIQAVCNSANIDSKQFILGLKERMESSNQSYSVKINQWPLDLLTDYIEKTHHRYTEEILLKIKAGLKSYFPKKEDLQLMIESLHPLVHELAGELGSHMKKEELILFPFIRKMVKSTVKLEPPRFNTVENPIEMMEHEHVTSRDLIFKIQKLTHNYQVKDDTDSELVYILTLIKALDEDLMQHLHIENNILFPQAIVMEKRKVAK